MLHEVDLVDVTACDRPADPIDRGRVVAGDQVCSQSPIEKLPAAMGLRLHA